MARKVATAALAAALVAVFPARAGAALPRLQGTVGPGFSINLERSGRSAKTLRAGTYLIVVADRSPIHNFHLRGPGVNKVITSVAFVGRKTVRVELRPGRYSYVCDPHHTLMHGSFRVR
jgi:plastocyanin